MLASDYIVQFLRQKGVTDIFGYPGGMVTYLMESLDQWKSAPRAHLCYHEQACAMAACGWAEMTHLPGVAYATSGPGATNLLTGISCAFFESLPAIFITGQVNTYEMRGSMKVRQRGFQETDIVSIVRPVTKMAVCVKDPDELPELLEKAWTTAMGGRPGPVLLDIPMNVQRSELKKTPITVITSGLSSKQGSLVTAEIIVEALQRAKCPVILAGHGVRTAGQRDAFRQFSRITGIPVVTSMIAVDVLPSDDPCNFGFIGAYGARYANWIINHCDMLLVLGSRLDCRQTGVNKELFAPNAEIYRVDVDAGEMTNRVHENEQQFEIALETLLPTLVQVSKKTHWQCDSWKALCIAAKERLKVVDAPNPGNKVAARLAQWVPDKAIIVTDVGQNQVWIAQSFSIKEKSTVLFSGGHGAMGYALPAAIGAAISCPNQLVLCCTGDGGLQMNIQELQTVIREQLPIKIILFNNQVLGMIHHFQEMYFSSNYVQTEASKGFTVPDFLAVARGYGWRTARLGETCEEQLKIWMEDEKPLFLEISLPQQTHVFPKLGINKPIHEQEPPVEPEIFRELENRLEEILRHKEAKR